MNNGALTLREYEKKLLSKSKINDYSARLFISNYGKYLSIEPPTFKTDGYWQIQASEWVGIFRIQDDLQVNIQPKTTIANLFKMLVIANEIAPKINAHALVKCETLPEAYEYFAMLLAAEVIRRGEQGLYRNYLPANNDLAYVRGRLDLKRIASQQVLTKIPCHYTEFTANNEDNQILVCALNRVIKSNICRDTVLKKIYQADRMLLGYADYKPIEPEACLDRHYSDLNADYELMHILSYMALKNFSPDTSHGDESSPPFLIQMSRLFEKFVFKWLKENLSSRLPHIKVMASYPVKIGSQHNDSYLDHKQTNHIDAIADIVLLDEEAGIVKCVIDAKYKVIDDGPDSVGSKKVNPPDVYQVHTYAKVLGTDKAFLVFPEVFEGFNGIVDGVSIKSLPFSLDGDLEQNGLRFLDKLLDNINI